MLVFCLWIYFNFIIISRKSISERGLVDKHDFPLRLDLFHKLIVQSRIYEGTVLGACQICMAFGCDSHAVRLALSDTLIQDTKKLYVGYMTNPTETSASVFIVTLYS